MTWGEAEKKWREAVTSGNKHNSKKTTGNDKENSDVFNMCVWLQPY